MILVLCRDVYFFCFVIVVERIILEDICFFFEVIKICVDKVFCFLGDFKEDEFVFVDIDFLRKKFI